MIICQCAVVSDDSIRVAVNEGARSVAQVCRVTGAGRDCGSCVFTVKRLLCRHEGLAQAAIAEVQGSAS